MNAYERLKPWCLIFGLNDFTHELIGPQTNNILLITWGQTTQQEVFKFLIIGPYLLTYLQFSIIKWAKQRPSQSPIDVKSDEAIQI